MSEIDFSQLSEALFKKTELLSDYYGVSCRLTIDPFEKMPNLFEKRQEIISQMQELDKKIDEISGIGEFFKNVASENPEMLEKIKPILENQREIKRTIHDADVKIGDRLAEFRNQLSTEVEDINKSKRVLDYFDMESLTQLTKGANLDAKM